MKAVDPSVYFAAVEERQMAGADWLRDYQARYTPEVRLCARCHRTLTSRELDRSQTRCKPCMERER